MNLRRICAPLTALAMASCSSTTLPQWPDGGRDDGRTADRGDVTAADRGAWDGPPGELLPPPVDASPADLGQPPRDAGSCSAVTPAKAPDPWTVRVPSAGFGGITTKSSGGHSDVFLKSPTDYIRIGARLDWGGTVVFFGLSADPLSNVIDANDTGRELQIALYDPTRARQPCAHDASCQSSPPACEVSITFLGWNPVQGGDECNHGAPVLSHGRAGDALQLVIRPVQWNPDWDAPDCRKSPCPAQGIPVQVTYTVELRFLSEHVVEVMTQVTSQETISHPSTTQELPTLYVSHGEGGPDLPLLLDASGKTVTLSTPGNDGFYYDNFTSPGPWVTWQDSSKSYGVGLATDQGIRDFQGWRGDGTTAPYFHNVRSRIAFGLAAGGTVRGIAYLALGKFATVKSELSAILAKRPPFGTLDAPAKTAVELAAGAQLTVSGWVLDTTAIANVRVELDGKQVATLPRTAQRADVCAIYPKYSGCPNVGFSGKVSLPGLGECPSLLRVIAEDVDGNATVLGERSVRLRP